MKNVEKKKVLTSKQFIKKIRIVMIPQVRNPQAKFGLRIF